MNIVNKYIKCIIILCFIFFITQIIIFGSIESLDIVNTVLIPSLSMSSVLVFIHVLSYIQKGYYFSQKAELKVKTLDISFLKTACKDRQIDLIEAEGSFIINTTPDYFKSFGEIINIEKHNSHYLIKSKSKIFLTLFDYGKNIDNVFFIKKIIEGSI